MPTWLPFNKMALSVVWVGSVAPHVHVPATVTSAAPLGACDVVPSGDSGDDVEVAMGEGIEISFEQNNEWTGPVRGLAWGIAERALDQSRDDVSRRRRFAGLACLLMHQPVDSRFDKPA